MTNRTATRKQTIKKKGKSGEKETKSFERLLWKENTNKKQQQILYYNNR